MERKNWMKAVSVNMWALIANSQNWNVVDNSRFRIQAARNFNQSILNGRSETELK